MEETVRSEFEKRALQAGVTRINEEISKYARWSKEEGLADSALWALEHLNKLKSEWEEELALVKDLVRVLHDTNEMLIANVARAQKKGKTPHLFELRATQCEDPQPGANLLHEPGWLSELSLVRRMRTSGIAGFMTFGTVFDSQKVDVVTRGALKRRIKWRRYPIDRSTGVTGPRRRESARRRVRLQPNGRR